MAVVLKWYIYDIMFVYVWEVVVFLEKFLDTEIQDVSTSILILDSQ